MQSVIIIIHLMIVLVMIGAVLLQKSEGGGLGMGGGAGFMSSRGTANLLTRTTAILAVCFFITSLFMSWWAAYDRRPASVFTTPAGQSGAPSAPVSSGSGGLLDTLRQSDQQQQNQSPAPPRSQ